MRSQTVLLLWIIIFIVDLIAFKGVYKITGDLPYFYKLTWRLAFVAISLISYALLMYGRAQMGYDFKGVPDYSKIFYPFGIALIFFAPKLIFGIFHLADDLLSFITIPVVKALSSGGSEAADTGRRYFITKAGLGIAGVLLGSMAYGVVRGRFDFKVFAQKMNFPKVPSSLAGFRIIQISDLHLGSFFGNTESVQKAVHAINSLKPDLIVFTGDMVNNYAAETTGWENVLSQLKATYGKYSILGNHDYGDYVPWDSLTAKKENLDQLKEFHKKAGFTLLLNQHAVIGEPGRQLVVAGVENWGNPPFVQYGDLNKALQGAPAQAFKLLLSHDPSHFEEQVAGHTDVDLTLSGHTHGMQFGIEVPGWKWSPVKYKYPRWAGRYEVKGQVLYVNRGLGYIGFPGRVGIRPEITCIELHPAVG